MLKLLRKYRASPTQHWHTVPAWWQALAALGAAAISLPGPYSEFVAATKAMCLFRFKVDSAFRAILQALVIQAAVMALDSTR